MGRAAIDALVNLMALHEVRAEAVAALGKIPAACIPWLAGHIDAGDPEVRRGVVEALGRMAHPAASAYLQRALEDRDPVVRRTAVSAVARLGTRGLAHRLSTMAISDASDAVRAAAAAAIGKTAKPGGDVHQ
jgi:HEAT repeat protein